MKVETTQASGWVQSRPTAAAAESDLTQSGLLHARGRQFFAYASSMWPNILAEQMGGKPLESCPVVVPDAWLGGSCRRDTPAVDLKSTQSDHRRLYP